MIRKIFIALVSLAIISVFTWPLVTGWGFFAHKEINRIAVFTLPPELFGFYKSNIEFVTEHAVDPDKRRYAVKGEAPRHFIDLDRYGLSPLDSVPKKWEDAVAKYTEDTLMEHGIVPWHIDVMVKRLSAAFRSGDYDRILRTSADLGHYIADAHVPLHTTKNYNGQLTNQRGIHGFWESRLPELFNEDFDFFVGKAVYIEDPLAIAWLTVAESFAAKDSVLLFEAQLNDRYPTDRKYSFENRGASLMKVYSEDYSKEYNQMLDGMVERRMRKAIITVGSLWFTAWVNAGQPDLEKYKDKKISTVTEQELAEQEKLYQNENIKGRSCD
ncbi:MAG: zinc dependent phospholipase C family protein [Bacteroidia bacterium]